MILKKNSESKERFEYYPRSDTYIMMRYEIQEGRAIGEFRHLYMEEEQHFSGFSEFIYKLQLFLEKLESPQMATCRRKTWGEPGKYRTMVTGKKKSEKVEKPVLLKVVSTKGMGRPGNHFVLHIRFCQNATWQGSIRWIERKQMLTFRSALELLMVLEESVSQGRK